VRACWWREGVLNLNDGAFWVDHVEVEHCVDFHRNVVVRDYVLSWHFDDLNAQISSHHYRTERRSAILLSDSYLLYSTLALLLFAFIIIGASVRILREYERAVATISYLNASFGGLSRFRAAPMLNGSLTSVFTAQGMNRFVTDRAYQLRQLSVLGSEFEDTTINIAAAIRGRPEIKAG
jgi:hypothetical protein